MELTVAIHAEGGSYWSEVRELPGCFASGRTLEELADALEEAVGMCLDDPATTLVQPCLHVGDVVPPRSLGDRQLNELPYHGVNHHGMIAVMKVDKLSVSFDPDLGDAVRDAAKRAGGGLSGWLAEAAQAKLRSEALGEFLDAWEAEHGSPSDDQLATAAAELCLDVPDAPPAV